MIFYKVYVVLFLSSQPASSAKDTRLIPWSLMSVESNILMARTLSITLIVELVQKGFNIPETRV